MTEYHTIYKGPEGETTQWEDIQRKRGNLPPKEPVWKPDPYKPQEEVQKDAGWLEKKDADELQELEEEFADDAFLEQYRLKRVQELQKMASRPRFGLVESIRGSEFVQKVTNAAEEVWVVVHLYKDSHEGCTILGACFQELAAKYPSSKFVQIISTDCIPNYPDQNLPTVLIYNAGSCKHNLVGLHCWGGRRTTPEQVAILLSKYGPICGDPQDEAEGEAQVRSLVQRLVADKEKACDEGDESSDFDDL